MQNLKIFIKRYPVFILVMAVVVSGFALQGIAADNDPTDQAITDWVEDELATDKAVPSQLIDVNTVEGVVTLSGSVDNILAKERAARIARMVKGVRSVINKMEVRPPGARSDSQIREGVEEALLYDPVTDSYEMDVTVEDGVVTQTGEVDSWEEETLCKTMAKGVKGVKGVVSNISITWPEERSDDEIKAEVEQALKWDVFVEHRLVNVEVNHGRAKLSGVVGTAAEKKQATGDAFVHGVRAVETSALEVNKSVKDDELKGKKQVEKSAREIEKAIMDAFLYDPRVVSFEITPEVVDEGDTVVLRGTVDNLKAKRAAELDARNTAGVRMVKNRIKVRPAEMVSDNKIEEKIKSAFERDPSVDRYDITVDVINGRAVLKGMVDTNFEKARASDIASKVIGVIKVDNNLKVSDDDPYIYEPYVDTHLSFDYEPSEGIRLYIPDRPDWKLMEDIKHQLTWSPFVDADEVNVSVEEGIVTLTGEVDSWSERNAAENNAYDAGALYVYNELIVK